VDPKALDEEPKKVDGVVVGLEDVNGPDVNGPDVCMLKLNNLERLLIFNKYKTFSVLIYSYINTSGNLENEKLCGNTTPEGRIVFTQFRVFPISTSFSNFQMFYICFII
jgi:hypothetical protein